MLNACDRSAYAEYSHSVCVYIYIYNNNKLDEIDLVI
jgi:hypothetical protein